MSNRAGWLTDAIVLVKTGGNRGQTYGRLSIGPSLGAQLCRGYLYAFNDLVQGEYVEAGPGGGEGFIETVALASDVAPVDITHALAVTDALRRIYGFVVYYHASNDAANRTVRVSLRKLGGTRPTGFTTGPNNTQVFFPSAGDLALIADQEGTIYAYGSEGRDGLMLDIDNGTKTVENAGTDPCPFPLWADEDEQGELFFDVGAAHANDRWSVYVFREEWINP